MNNTGKILLAGIVGAAAGATAGLLLAPESGKKTRKKMAKTADELKSSVAEFVEDSKEIIKDYAVENKEAMKEVVRNGADKVKEAAS
ncbi:MAG: hypothetical protein Salg2KO_04540 [Salibacteraceae bacterium]